MIPGRVLFEHRAGGTNRANIDLLSVSLLANGLSSTVEGVTPGLFSFDNLGDVRREAKRIEEKRKAERRQQWTERRRNLRRQDRELREVEQKVREETEPAFAAQPVRMETPRIRLFESE